MAFIYCADIYCNDCGKAIRRRLTDEGKAPAEPNAERSYDSNDFPKCAGDNEESDTPQHCEAGVKCINALTLGEDQPIKVGLLFGELTNDGVAYVEDAIDDANRDDNTWSRAVVGLWFCYYSDRGYTFKTTPNWAAETMEDRHETLSHISGLHVESYMQHGVRYYVFGPRDQALKTVCTYRKARIFAEGVAIGRELGRGCADGL